MMGAQESIARFQRAGITGMLIADFLVKYIGTIGAYTILIMLGTMALILTGEFLVSPFFLNIVDKTQDAISTLLEKMHVGREVAAVNKPKANIHQFGQSLKETLKAKSRQQEAQEEEEEEQGEYENDDEENESLKVLKPSKPKIHIATTAIDNVDRDKDYEPLIVGEYHMPSLELLSDSPQIPANKIQDGLINDAKLLEETLLEFGVTARVADIERGPAITRYELEPAPGVKVQKITNLSDDIALAMKASVVRIVAPIPGKNRVGIEVPNADSAFVYLKDVLSTSQFQSSSSKLTLSLGKDIAGKPMIADLAEMPHLLIAGTTGSGKTVCVNGIIMSMLLNASPDEVKFVMIDPKMVELAPYNDIPHLLCPVITDTKKSAMSIPVIPAR